MVAASAAAAYGADVLHYKVTLSYENAKEFLGAVVLALFFVADDELCWREDDAGGFEVSNGGRPLLRVDGGAGDVHFLSLFERRFVPVDEARAEKIVALAEFASRPPAPGDALEFDYPLKGKTYRVNVRCAGAGRLRLASFPAREFECVRLSGAVSGWEDGRRAEVAAFVGRGGEYDGKILKLSFKFAGWPRATLTLAGAEPQ
jgi:hypothetical protein